VSVRGGRVGGKGPEAPERERERGREEGERERERQ